MNEQNFLQKAVDHFVSKNGQQWVHANTSHCTNDVEKVANLIYYDFLESETGTKEWGKGGQSERKVDRLMEAIENEYVGPVIDEDDYNREVKVKLDQKHFAYDVKGKVALVSVADSLNELVYDGVF